MSVALPDIPVVILENNGILWLSPDGDIQNLNAKEAASVLREPTMLCNAPLFFDRLGIERMPVFDALELFAFVRPGQFCVPTASGLASAMGIPTSDSTTDQALNLVRAIEMLLAELQQYSDDEKKQCVAIATAMAAAAPIWPWSPFILATLDTPMTSPIAPFMRETLSVWRKLPEWEDKPPPNPAGHEPVSPAEARMQLDDLVKAVIGGRKAQKAETRIEQSDYASALTAAFQPLSEQGKPHWVMAEAGTGVGKTLGYLAPSLAWAGKNDGQVWISTFTRHLQNQLQHDLSRIFPHDPTRAVIRKGRENYLCLLNVDENINQFTTGDLYTRIGMGLMLRWITATRDGDLTGGDLPGWLPVLVGNKSTLQMADRRGECIHQACPHYGRCFIERGIRNSRNATLVIANHALTLSQEFTTDDNDDDRKTMPNHLVFDEGHHLFEAADASFSAALSGQESAEMKRWLVSDHALKRFRRRGLAQRLINTLGESHAVTEYAHVLREVANFLPEPGWMERIHKAMCKDETEEFLAAIRMHVLAQSEYPDSPYDLEAHCHPINDDLAAKATALALRIKKLLDVLSSLMRDLNQVIQDDITEQFPKRSIISIMRNIQQRCLDPLTSWYHLAAFINDPTPSDFTDWFGIKRIDGRDWDIGLYRHYIDPMKVFAKQSAQHAHGIVLTSATLKSSQHDNDQSWSQAEQRLGGTFLHQTGNPPTRVQVPSPFNYPEQTRVILINDVNGKNPQEIASAFNTLFMASGGGGLGLFTAINRLRSAYPYLQKALSAQNIPLYAQHMDGMNTRTLIDIFRAEENSCLLGTDALRDGVDVPGRALRLVVYDRIPWPRPGILHRARRDYFGKRDYDMYLTSIRLRQSFGRLVRTENDKGVFVLLESALPSVLYNAFPAGVEISKMSLLDAKNAIQAFLNPVPSAMVSERETIE